MYYYFHYGLWHYHVIQDNTRKRKKINNNSTYQNLPSPFGYHYVNEYIIHIVIYYSL